MISVFFYWGYVRSFAFFAVFFFIIMSIMSISIHEKSKSNWLQQKENMLMVWVEHITAQKIHRKTFSRIFLFFIRFILFSFSTNHSTRLVSYYISILSLSLTHSRNSVTDHSTWNVRNVLLFFLFNRQI